jgi:hypothetical protein
MKKMKMLLYVIGLIACSAFAVSALAATASRVDTVAELKPLIFEFKPTVAGVLTLEPGRFPEVNVQWIRSGEEAAAQCLVDHSNQPEENFHVWHDLLDTGDIAIPEAYRAKGKVLVNWNTRILGEQPETPPNPCGSFTGTLELIYKGGLAYSRIINVADGNKVLKELTMSIPDGGGEVIDPTHTGSVTLTPDMFAGGKLPAVIRLKVQWANDTSLRLTSTQATLDETTGMVDGQMHNVLVTITRQ